MFFSINCFVNENYVITIELILAEDENMTFYIVLCIPLLELLLILILIIAKIVNTYIVFALSWISRLRLSSVCLCSSIHFATSAKLAAKFPSVVNLFEQNLISMM